MLLTRFAYLEDRTLGRLECFGEAFWTIENPWLDNKPNVSCIPEGEYQMERYDSPTHGFNTWQFVGVPNRTYIQIHVANYASNVMGCIGLGNGVIANLAGVSSSRDAMDRFGELTIGMDRATIKIASGALRGSL